MLDATPARSQRTNNRVVVLSPHWDGWRWHAARFPEIEWHFVDDDPNALERRVHATRLSRVRGCFEAAALAKRIDACVVVAHGPYYATWAAYFGKKLGLRAPILGFTFNYPEMPVGIKRRIAARMVADVERFVVFSSMERDLYARTLGIPRERFDIVRWSMKPPECAQGRVEEGEYVCAVGGNGRDYRTLLLAAARLPEIPFVLVVRPESMRGLDVPPNVRVRVNLETAKTMNVVKHARFMVLPLAGNDVACGHVTLVAAMHLGQTFIVTESSGVADYVVDGSNGLACPPFDVDAMVSRVRELWGDRERTERMGRAGLRFADLYCSERVAADHLRSVLEHYGACERTSASEATVRR